MIASSVGVGTAVDAETVGVATVGDGVTPSADEPGSGAIRRVETLFIADSWRLRVNWAFSSAYPIGVGCLATRPRDVVFSERVGQFLSLVHRTLEDEAYAALVDREVNFDSETRLCLIIQYRDREDRRRGPIRSSRRHRGRQGYRRLWGRCRCYSDRDKRSRRYHHGRCRVPAADRSD